MNTAGIDFAAIEKRARRMNASALEWSAFDCGEAADCADALERQGCFVIKSGGDYRDEASIYRRELTKRNRQTRVRAVEPCAECGGVVFTTVQPGLSLDVLVARCSSCNGVAWGPS